MTTKQTIRTETITSWEFTEAEIMAALRETGRIPNDVCNVQSWVRVPGRGDWSNTNLHLDDHPVVVRATVIKVEEKEGL